MKRIYRNASGASFVRYAVLAALISAICPAAHAGFVNYVIRTAADGSAPVINAVSGGATEFVIAKGSQKAATGSNDVNGYTIGDLAELDITRLDNRGRFTAGTGPYSAPYLNLWITDGSGHFAVAANEPSDAQYSGLYNNGWAFSYDVLKNKRVKIFENNSLSWLPNNGVGLTFADLEDFVIMAPSVAQLAAGWSGLGGGAPRELGTNVAYGVNWIFGDSLSNYVSGDRGYIVSGARVMADDQMPTPEPATYATMLGAFGVLAVMWRRRAN